MSKPVASVVGGTGYVGSHIVAKLLSSGYRVRASTRATETAGWLEELGDVEVTRLALGVNGGVEAEYDALLEGAEAAFFCAGTEKKVYWPCPLCVCSVPQPNHTAIALRIQKLFRSWSTLLWACSLLLRVRERSVSFLRQAVVRRTPLGCKTAP